MVMSAGLRRLQCAAEDHAERSIRLAFSFLASNEEKHPAPTGSEVTHKMNARDTGRKSFFVRVFFCVATEGNGAPQPPKSWTPLWRIVLQFRASAVIR
jgi:hypothetical protein